MTRETVKTQIGNILKGFQIQDADRKADQLYAYMELVLERNRHVNLTAIRQPGEFVEKHYADSLAVCRLPQMGGAQRILDMGTGGGFPGIPLAVAYPEKEFVLVDSLNKRIRIIREFCQELGIRNVTAIHGRAEELGRRDDLRDRFDVCVSRAVADLRILAEFCLPFVEAQGCFIAYKGADCQEEVGNSKRAIKLLGGQLEGIVPAFAAFAEGKGEGEAAKTGEGDAAPACSEHVFVVIRKTAPTPRAYPRRPGLPAKKPL